MDESLRWEIADRLEQVERDGPFVIVRFHRESATREGGALRVTVFNRYSGAHMFGQPNPWEPDHPRTMHRVASVHTYEHHGPPDALDPIRVLASAWDGVACSGQRPVDTLDLGTCPVCRYKGVTDVEWRREDSVPVSFGGGLMMRNFEVNRIIVEPCGCLVEQELWGLAATVDIRDDGMSSEIPLWVWKRNA